MNEIIVALDNLTLHKARELIHLLYKNVWGFKFNDLLIEHGADIIHWCRHYSNVFADAKLHDIPRTVEHCVDKLAFAGANMISVHLSGGLDMCSAAMRAAKARSNDAKIIGITMLTSLTPENIRTIYRGFPLERLSEIALKADVDGVVCSAQELDFWKLFKFVKVVPGFRPFGSLSNDDHARPCMSVETDYVVVGRPVIEAKDPLQELAKIKSHLGETVARQNVNSV